MKQQRHTVDQIIGKLRRADIELGEGKKVPGVCKVLQNTERSALMLVAARLRHVAGTRWGTRKYLDMARLAEHRCEKTFESRAQQNGEFPLTQ